MIYPSDFQKCLTFSVRSNQSTNKMATNDYQLKLTIRNVPVYMIFQCKCWKWNKFLMWEVKGDARGAPETYN